MMYAEGQGVVMDYVQAHVLLSLAGADDPDLGMQYLIALRKKMSPEQKARAKKRSSEQYNKILEEAAEAGDAIAQHKLGHACYFGIGVPQDYKEAVKYYRMAADQGSFFGQSSLGMVYAEGKGVTQDRKEAAKWYRLAADQGYGRAMNRLARMYFNGDGVPQDYKEAIKWWRLAVDQGDLGSQLRLGVMYEFGTGVPQDYVKSYAWYHLTRVQSKGGMTVRRSGMPDLNSEKLKAALAKKMTPEQIARGQELARELDKKIKAAK
jgi:hypothetical protein